MTFVDKSLKQAKSLAKSGKLAEARALYEAVLERFPNNKRALEAYQALEVPAKDQKRTLTQDEQARLIKAVNENRLQEALTLSNSLAQQCGKSAFLHNITGNIFERAGNYKSAAAHYEAALQLRPNDAGILTNLANVLNITGAFERAKQVLEHAIACDPKSAVAHNCLGNTLHELGNSEAAVACFETAASLNPKLAEPLSNLGNLYVEIGDKDKAKAVFEAALLLAPHRAEILRSLYALRKAQNGDPAFKRLQEALEHQNADSNAQMNIHFALGKAFDDVGDYEKAFEHFQSANDLGAQQSNYKPDDQEPIFQKIKAAFDEAPKALPLTTDATPKPIFILGMPRSGTSLIEQILASHKDVYGAGELPHLGKAVIPHIQNLGDGVLPTQEMLKDIRETYLSKIKIPDGTKNFTDKLPMNFRWIGFILCALPEAKILHIKRDPMAVCWSIYRTGFPTVALAYQWKLETIAHYYRLYDDLMQFWERQFPNQVITVDYDALTENQEQSTRDLLDACGLDWDESCLDFHKAKRSVRTASADQVRQAMYKASSQAWRNYENELEPLKLALNAPV